MTTQTSNPEGINGVGMAGDKHSLTPSAIGREALREAFERSYRDRHGHWSLSGREFHLSETGDCYAARHIQEEFQSFASGYLATPKSATAGGKPGEGELREALEEARDTLLDIAKDVSSCSWLNHDDENGGLFHRIDAALALKAAPASVLQALYDSEINASISTFWDGGFTASIGDELNGFNANAQTRTYNEAEAFLDTEARRLFPDSTYALARPVAEEPSAPVEGEGRCEDEKALCLRSARMFIGWPTAFKDRLDKADTNEALIACSEELAGFLLRHRAQVRAALSSLSKPSGGEAHSRHSWCQPGDDAKRRWLVFFEDTEQGIATFTDEKEAREYYSRANAGGWNCYLFAAAPQHPTSIPGTPEAEREGWKPNFNYDHEETWPPQGHVLGHLFHDARLFGGWKKAYFEELVSFFYPSAPTPQQGLGEPLPYAGAGDLDAGATNHHDSSKRGFSPK